MLGGNVATAPGFGNFLDSLTFNREYYYGSGLHSYNLGQRLTYDERIDAKANSYLAAIGLAAEVDGAARITGLVGKPIAGEITGLFAERKISYGVGLEKAATQLVYSAQVGPIGDVSVKTNVPGVGLTGSFFDGTLQIDFVNAGKNFSVGTRIYAAAIEAAQKYGEIKEIRGWAGGDNKAAYLKNLDINDTPRAKILNKMGSWVHTWENGEMVSRPK